MEDENKREKDRDFDFISPRDIKAKMTLIDDKIENQSLGVIHRARLNATANAVAESKAAIWADHIEIESIITLDCYISNYETGILTLEMSS